MRVLKMRSAVASHWKLTTTNWEDHQSWSSYNYLRSCQRTQCWPLPSFSIWSKLERWKSSIRECLMSWLKKKKVLNSIQQQQTISQSNCDMQWKVDFMWQPAMTSSVVIESQRWSSKTLSKAKLAPRKSHGHCLGVCCWSDPQQLSESQWNHYIWELCSANQWDALKTPMPVACTGQQNGPVLHDNAQPLIAQPTLPKLNELGYEVLSHPPYSPDLSPTDYHLQASQQLFAGKMLPQPAGGRKCFPRVHWILKHKFLHYRNKKNLFLSGKNVLIVMVPILINKDEFEPSYNDLKFTIWNHNYFFTNLNNEVLRHSGHRKKC